MARGTLRNKREDREQALVGRVDDHHHVLLTSLLTHLDFLDEQIADSNDKIGPVVSAPSDEKAELISPSLDDQHKYREAEAGAGVTPEISLIG